MEKAKKAHKNWLENLRKIVNEMRIYPLQTNGHKCAFGHFYNSIQGTHPSILKEWKDIDTIHRKFHGLGEKALKAVKNNNKHEVQKYYEAAEKVSKGIFISIDKIILEAENKWKKVYNYSNSIVYIGTVNEIISLTVPNFNFNFTSSDLQFFQLIR